MLEAGFPRTHHVAADLERGDTFIPYLGVDAPPDVVAWVQVPIHLVRVCCEPAAYGRTLHLPHWWPVTILASLTEEERAERQREMTRAFFDGLRGLVGACDDGGEP
jgi:hypothetical protein